jgi:hypothetical protein
MAGLSPVPGRRRGSGGIGGIVAGEVSDYPLPSGGFDADSAPPLVREVCERAANDYWRWERQVLRTGGCRRPIRLSGRVRRADRATGELVEVYSTKGEPDRQPLVACGSRRASRCKSCAFTYRGDAFQLVVTGIRGGKGMPESVAAHPMVFVTFTAPSFGAVHAHREKNGRTLACRPRSSHKTCPHGVRLGCSVRHKAADPRVGAPLCAECFDAEAQAVWNALVPALWKRTAQQVRRSLARLAGMTEQQLKAVVRVRFAKVAEYQRRGAVHLHAVIRLDATPPDEDPTLVAPPPERFGTGLLVAAVRAARERSAIECRQLGVLGRAETTIRWGSELDVQPIVAGAGELSAAAIGGYIAKYAVKQAEGLGLPDRPIDCDADLEALELAGHLKAVVRAAWRLGCRPDFAGLGLAEHATGLGFGGQFLTKSRRYSTTFAALEEVRRSYARRRHNQDGEEGPDAWDPPDDDDQAVTVAEWHYLGWGYQTVGEAYLAASAAARAREERRLGKEELRSWVAA